MSDSATHPEAAQTEPAPLDTEVAEDDTPLNDAEASPAPQADQGVVDDAEDDAEDNDDSGDADEEENDSGDENDSDDPKAAGRSTKLAALEEEGDIAADYLEELLDIADLDGDIDTYTEGGRAHVSIVTEATILVGKDGEVLDALQDLCRLAVMTETGKRSRLMLDIAGHRDRRRRELTDLATDAVEETKTSGEPVRLAPMNPFERKIVHDVVAAAGLMSESDGEEPNRRVVVLPTQ